MEFLNNARALEIFTIRKTANFPKKYRFFIATDIASIARGIYEHAKIGNSIYPVNRHEAQIRLDHFERARAEAYNLAAQLEIAQELFGVDMKDMERWSSMISLEIKLLKAVISTDRARYKELP